MFPNHWTSWARPPSNQFPAVSANWVMQYESDSGVALSGSAVTSWTSQGSGYIASQATGSKRPVYSTSDADFGGLPSLAFSAANVSALDNTTDTPLTTSSPRTVFAVFKVTDTVGGTIVDFKRGATDFAVQWYDAGTAGPQFIFGNAVLNVRLAARATMGTIRCMTLIDPGTAGTIVVRDNGVSKAVDSSLNIPAEVAGAGFTIGARATYGQAFTGTMTALLVADAALAAVDYLRVERYLRVKYRLP